MSKKSRKKRRQRQKQAPSRRLPLLVIAAGGGLLVAAIALLLVRPWSGGDAGETSQVDGAPRLLVNQTVVDEGYVRYNVPVRTAFRLSNVGDQPLKIVEAPQVRLVDGC